MTINHINYRSLSILLLTILLTLVSPNTKRLLLSVIVNVLFSDVYCFFILAYNSIRNDL
jgi:hypothetical protein